MPTLILTIIQTLINWDIHASLFINGMHCAFLDNFMMMFSGRFVWIPMYVSLLIVMIRNFPIRVNLICLLVSVILITVIDQTSSAILRPLLCRPRPANADSPIVALVHVVDNYRGGHYGFPSSHAANCWGAAFFVFYVFRRHVLSRTFAAWALVMCWSRVYLGVHYVGDIIFGTFIGFVEASIIYFFFQKGMHKTTESFKPIDGMSSPKLFIPSIVCAVETGLMLIIACFTRFSF